MGISFDGKVEAIKVALAHLGACPPFSEKRQVVIFSDFQAAIPAIANCFQFPGTMSMAHCTSLIGKMRNKCKAIILQWILYHYGISGDEKADKLAKKAVLLIRPRAIWLTIGQSHQELTKCLGQLT